MAVATALIGVTLAAGVSLAFRALGIGVPSIGAPKAKEAVGPPQVFRQSIANSFIVYGKRRVGGLLVFFHPRQSGDDHYRYFVIAVAGHRCKGIVTWMLGDEEVTVDGSNKVTSGKYANAAWLWFVRGTDSDTANATFVSECGGKWTSGHKGLGVAKIYAKFKMTDAVVEAGMPNITAVIEGRDQIADPRDSSTGYSRNAALVFYDWLQMPREEGGFGIYDDEIPEDSWISAQANVCDETVNGDPRYALDAVITTGAPPDEVRDAMVVNQAGSYAYSGGKHLMRPGYWVPSSETLSEDDLAGPIQVSPFSSADAAANEVAGSYIEPEDGYQGAPFTTRTLDPAPSDVRQIDLDLAFITNKDQADRVAEIMLRRAQAEKTVLWPMNIAGLKVKPLDTVMLASDRYGLSNYAFSVTKWGLSPDYGVVLSLREENADIYDDPAPTARPSVPGIDSADRLPTDRELTTLIANSWTTDLTFSISSAGAVTISDHQRDYADKSVDVDGTGGSPLATTGGAGDLILVYYDQRSRTGGSVTYLSLVLVDGNGDTGNAFASSAHPYRHYVLSGYVPASGSTSGGSGAGSGGGGTSPWCVTEDTPVLMADGREKPAGLVVAGDRVRTRHETTLEWGDYRVVAARIVGGQPLCRAVIDGRVLRATPDHRVRTNGGWKRMAELGAPDGTGAVVQLTVEDAHTYVSNGLLSHNIKNDPAL